MSWARRIRPAALAAISVPLVACGSADDPVPPRPQPDVPARSELARIAVAGPVRTLDPLFARSRSERLLARQVHEPLVDTLEPPFGTGGDRQGPGRILSSPGRQTKWRVRLRPGVRFQDGSSLDASAVLANVERWRSRDLAASQLPGLLAADSPRPGVVRFQFGRPTPNFPRLIADPRLGLVSPEAIAAAPGPRIPQGPTGAGPFEPREREATRALFARNPAWWGTELRLGPGVQQLEVLIVPRARDRLEQLRSAAVQVADDLGDAAERRLRRSPLLTTLPAGRGILGVERSVRGIRALNGRQPLSQLWLTDLR